jgi:4-hydroxythreonine-4-phosphate dehydrogenase
MTISSSPALAITLGDPAGIGPEVVVKALSTPGVLEGCRILLVGDVRVLRYAAESCGSRLSFYAATVATPKDGRPADRIAVLDQPMTAWQSLVSGEVSALAGAAAVRAVEAAADLALAHEVDAVVTAPLNKEAMRQAGFTYDGHTELLALRTGAADVCMLLAGERLRVAHVTGHRSLGAAAACPSPARLRRVIELTKDAMQRFGFALPRIAVAGLNPHAGEGGLFGRDEIDVIAPTVAAFAAMTSDAAISGPYPPDTVFRRAAAGEFDAVVAMYHDQGHIPIKMIEFDTAVNVTLGLPIIRTSPDHGTAFDIAGQGIANPANMIAAIRLAVRMAGTRTPRR